MRFTQLLVAFAAARLACASSPLFTGLEKRTSCSTPDGDGTCESTSSCGTFSVAGYCPGSATNQCCVSESCSTSYGSGTCKDTSHSCSGSYIAGACPGPSSVECCVANPTCSTPDGSGTCKSTSSCSGYSLAGYCPGPSSNQCCLSSTCSTPSGSGSCKNTANGCSGGSFIAGYCPGSSSVECCVPTSSSSTCSTPSGNGKCQSVSSCSGFSLAGYCPGGTDNQCCLPASKCSTAQGAGTCKNTDNGCSGGAFVAGACPGSSTVECCVPGASSGGGGGGGGGGNGSNIPTLDISSAQTDAFFSCAISTYKKIIIRGYSQACSEGGAVDSNLAVAASQAKAAGFTNIEAYLFPCTGSTGGVACKSASQQLSEFEAAVASAGLTPTHLWLDIEPTTSPCEGWQLGTSANIQLAEQWISLIKASKYSYGVYANGNQWSGMFGTQSQSIGSSDLPLWAVQDDGQPGVSTTTTFMGGWTVAYGKQYDLSATVCGGSVDISSFNG